MARGLSERKTQIVGRPKLPNLPQDFNRNHVAKVLEFSFVLNSLASFFAFFFDRQPQKIRESPDNNAENENHADDAG